MKQLLDLAILAAQSAANHFQKNEGPRKIEKEWGRDIKMAADFNSEEIILDTLLKETDFSIISEERGTISGKTDHSMTWIVDPLDGSLNFSRDIPLYCISIGLWQSGKPILGVVLDLTRNNVYTGIVGAEARVNNNIIKVSKIDKKSSSIICTGFPVNFDFDTENTKNFLNDIQTYKKIRLIGSAALSLCWVANGSVEAYKESNIMWWDVAAGIPIVLAAGGYCSFTPGSKDKSLNVIATNGLI